jgi:hypothetical protein
VEEVIVATVDSEAVAELIAGRLQTDGIPARVRYDSQAGIPRQIAPAALGFGPGAFRIAVNARDAGRAREALADAEPAPPRRDRRVLRTIAALLLAIALSGYLTGAAQLVPLLFEK